MAPASLLAMGISNHDVRLAATYQMIQSGAKALDDGTVDKAQAAITIALRLLSITPQESAAEIATCQTLLGRCALVLDQHQIALDWFRLSLPIYLGCDGPCSQAVSAAHSDQGTALLGLGHYEEARHHFEEAVAIDESTLGKHHPTTARRRANLGVSFYKMGDLTSAIRSYSQAMCVLRATLGDHHPDMAAKWNNLGLAWKAMGELDLALSAFREAHVIDQQSINGNQSARATTFYNLGTTCVMAGKIEAALEYLASSYLIRHQRLGATHPQTVDTAIALDLAKIAQRR